MSYEQFFPSPFFPSPLPKHAEHHKSHSYKSQAPPTPAHSPPSLPPPHTIHFHNRYMHVKINPYISIKSAESNHVQIFHVFFYFFQEFCKIVGNNDRFRIEEYWQVCIFEIEYLIVLFANTIVCSTLVDRVFFVFDYGANFTDATFQVGLRNGISPRLYS